jgi:hypothetical protein
MGHKSLIKVYKWVVKGYKSLDPLGFILYFTLWRFYCQPSTRLEERID